MTEPATPAIAGKIAAIIDNTTLVLNVGTEHGVREGHLFAIVAAHDEIVDPDSGESLGAWESVKGRVVVTHVQERMSTARPPLLQEEDERNTGTLSEMMVRHSFGLYGDRHERQRLEVRTEAVSGRPRTPPIAVGDMARLISLEGLEQVARVAESAAAIDLPSKTYAASDAAPADAETSDAP